MTIADGTASVTATSNGTAGTYSVTASGAGEQQASFSLTNNVVYTVTNTEDSGTYSGFSGDLRYCIAQANAQTLSTIEFSPGLTGTIDLGSGLVISTNVTITESGSSPLSVQGGGPSSNFSVFSVSSGAALSISGLTITDGFSLDGGAIDNQGTLLLTDDTLSGNSASAAGGGIFNEPLATATLVNDTIAVNSAAAGGGIFNDSQATATLVNDTIAANSAAAGGGMFSSGTTAFYNTIVADNTNGGDLSNSGPVSGYNDLIDGNTSLSGVTPLISSDPLLAALWKLRRNEPDDRPASRQSSHRRGCRDDPGRHDPDHRRARHRAPWNPSTSVPSRARDSA